MNQDETRGAKLKQSLYFSDGMIQEIAAEAARLDRSMSWVVQAAWRISRGRMRGLPSTSEHIAQGPVRGVRDDEAWTRTG